MLFVFRDHGRARPEPIQRQETGASKASEQPESSFGSSLPNSSDASNNNNSSNRTDGPSGMGRRDEKQEPMIRDGPHDMSAISAGARVNSSIGQNSVTDVNEMLNVA